MSIIEEELVQAPEMVETSYSKEEMYIFYENYMKNLYVPVKINSRGFYKTLNKTFRRLEQEWEKL